MWHQTNLLSLFEIHVKGFDKKNFKFFKVFFVIFVNIFEVMFLFTILAPKKPPKKSSQFFEKGVASDKFTFTV